MFVGIDFVKTFGVDAVLLNEVPLDTLKGCQVLSITGKKIGLVKEVLKKGNKMRGVKVQQGRHSIEIKASKIKEVGKSLILRKNWKQENNS